MPRRSRAPRDAAIRLVSALPSDAAVTRIREGLGIQARAIPFARAVGLTPGMSGAKVGRTATF